MNILNKLAVAILVFAFSIGMCNAETELSNLRAPELDGFIINFSSDGKIAMIKHSKSGEFNSWYIYNVTTDDNNNLQFDGVGEVLDNNRGTTYLSSKPLDAIAIENLDSDTPHMTGKFNAALTKNAADVFNDFQWMIAYSLSDYKAEPNAYHPDSVARLKTDAYALVESYKTKAGKERYQRYLEMKAQEKARDKRNARVLGLLLIPLVISIILGPLTSGGKINNNFSKKVKAIAITEILGLIIIATSFYFFNSTWWAITFAVLAIITILIYNLFFGAFFVIDDHIRKNLNVKYPWCQGIIFGFSSLLAPACIAVIISAFIFGGTDDAPAWLTIVCNAAFLVAIFFAGVWYRNSLIKRDESLKEDFWAIAVTTSMTALSIVAFSLIIIGYIIFNGTWKMFLTSSQQESGAGWVKSTSGTENCSTCKLLGSQCPNSREMGSVTQVCNYYIRNTNI